MMKSSLSRAQSIAPSTARVHLYGNRVSCGFPSPAQDHVEQPISLDDLLNIQAPHIYVVRAAGSSMTGAGIFDDDWLVVDRSLQPRHGHIIIAALFGEPLVRRLHRHEGQVQLMAENPAYAPITIDPEADFFVWGVVRHSIRRHCLETTPTDTTKTL